MPKPGYITPSSFSDLMSNGRGSTEMGKTAMNVVNLLTLDLMGVERAEEQSTPASCQWGIDHEWEAIEAYQDATFREVFHPVEFRVSRTHDYVGGSMDGLVGSRGGIEVKCPFNSKEHLANIRDAAQFKMLYKYQLQGYFWIYELDWIDCVSYDPRFPDDKKLSIYRAYPDDNVITALKARCELAYKMACDSISQSK